MPETQATNLSDWRRQSEGELFTLPSGNTARLRRVHVLDLVKLGRVPDALTGLVAQMIDTKNPSIQVTLKDLERYVEVINLVCIAAFAEPKVAAQPSEDALGVEELTFLDRSAVFEWCHVETRRLEPFRAKPGRAVAAAQPGDGVRETAERAAGD